MYSVSKWWESDIVCMACISFTVHVYNWHFVAIVHLWYVILCHRVHAKVESQFYNFPGIAIAN